MRRPGFEQVAVEKGPRSGATIAIAVHSTRLGPALGGARLWHYPHEREAVQDAKRLARAMTSKAAIAGLALGGGKGVIAHNGSGPPEGEERRALLLDFGDAVEELGGSYVTAEDVGTTAADMVVIRERTSHVVGLPEGAGGSGDPSPVTARGLIAAIRACLEHRFGDPEIADRRACVIGAGNVGSRLARLLAAEGASLAIADVDPARRALAAELGAEWIAPDAALEQSVDVLAPCALGEAIDPAIAGRLGCAIVCGAANNILTHDRAAEVLAARGILYAPDFIVNAGGLISVYSELQELGRDEVLELADRIGATLRSVFAAADAAGVTPLVAARRLAAERLALPEAAAA